MRLVGWFLAAAILIAAFPSSGRTQCMLANPSFELNSGSAFGGWNQFGQVVAVAAPGTHGQFAAQITGPNLGGWDLSAVWQPLDTAPGDQWNASVVVRNSSGAPLTGSSRAILNVEWRNAAGALISYESHDLADATSPTDSLLSFSVQSAPAPAGAVATRLLLGTLQAPGASTPVVIFDQARFEKSGPPTPEDLQWVDFPGGTTLDFAGRTWRVKGPGYYGPGPNTFSNAPSEVWVDGSDQLHLTLRNVSGIWKSTEVVLEEILGYGDYRFTTAGDLDLLDAQAVLGIFLWEYGPCYEPANGWWNPYNEMDIEFSRWGNPSNNLGQFVAQPYDFPGNINRFAATFSSGEITTHAFNWLPDRVEFRSWRGGPNDESPGALIHSWTYTGPHISRPERPRIHLNLWKLAGTPAGNQEVVFQGFQFTPQNAPVVDVPSDTPHTLAARVVAAPNPFRSQTLLSFTLPENERVSLSIHDVEGRRVRQLLRDREMSGSQRVHWDGMTDDGVNVPAGVYFYRLQGTRMLETGRVVRIK